MQPSENPPTTSKVSRAKKKNKERERADCSTAARIRTVKPANTIHLSSRRSSHMRLKAKGTETTTALLPFWSQSPRPSSCGSFHQLPPGKKVRSRSSKLRPPPPAMLGDGAAVPSTLEAAFRGGTGLREEDVEGMPREVGLRMRRKEVEGGAREDGRRRWWWREDRVWEWRSSI